MPGKAVSRGRHHGRRGLASRSRAVPQSFVPKLTTRLLLVC